MSWRAIKDAVASTVGYTTPLFIEMADPRLGGFYSAIVLAIVVYSCIYNIFIQHGHMTIENPVGIASVTFRLPSKDGCNEFEPGCNLDLWPPEQLPYCLAAYKNKDLNTTAAATVASCLPMDSLDAVNNEDSSVLLGTYMEWLTQVRKCDPMFAVGQNVYADYKNSGLELASIVSVSGAGTARLQWSSGKTQDLIKPVENLTFTTDFHCTRVWETETGPAKDHPVNLQPPKWRVHQTEVFIPNVERFMFIIDHSMSAPRLGITSHWQNSFGYLLSHDPDQCANHPRRSTTKADRVEDIVPSTTAPCYIRSKLVNFTHEADVFDVSDLLQAAGIYLDRPHKSSFVDGSYRRHGVFLVLSIMYSNLEPYKFWAGDVRYHYEVYALHESQGEAERSYFKVYPSSRVVERITGIKIMISQDGFIGAFSWTRLLVNLASCLTMLAVASFVVDNIGLYCLPERHVFAHLKYPNHTLNVKEKEAMQAEIQELEAFNPTVARTLKRQLGVAGEAQARDGRILHL